MSLTLEQKKAVVSEVHAMASDAQAAIAAEYIGLTVAQLTEFRSKARNDGVQVRVVKNSLAKRAIADTEFECLGDSLSGPMLLVFSGEDPGAGARLVRDFSKENEQLVTKAIAFAGELRPAEDLKVLASLPTLEEARAKLLSVFNAPATQLVRVMAEPGGKFARLLSARRDQLNA